MNELTDFLLARVAEDEAVARAVPPLQAWEDQEYGWRFSTNESDHFFEDTLFVTRFNPTRVLAECEAKRRIVALMVEHEWDAGWSLDARVLGAMAQVYADHPDCRQEWLSWN